MVTLTLTYGHNISSMKSGIAKSCKKSYFYMMPLHIYAITNREHVCIPERYTCGILSVFKITASWATLPQDF